jgi:hypothetical protein
LLAPTATCNRPIKVWFKLRRNGKGFYYKPVEWKVPKVKRIQVDGATAWLFDSLAASREFAPGYAVNQILPIFPI